MRGKAAKHRKVKGDVVYDSKIVTKLINKVMMHGKKTIAERHVYNALDNLSKQTKKEPMEALEKAIKNVTPEVEVRSRRVGGANYQVPVPVSEDRQLALAIRWIVDASRGKKGKGYENFLTEELINAYNGTGAAVKKREDTLRMAEAGKAFSHFAW